MYSKVDNSPTKKSFTMYTLSAFLAVAVFVSTVSAAGNTCKQGNVVHKPNSNTTNYYYWPSTWRENATAPKLAAGQDCSWTVTVPTGYYAKLIIDGKVVDNDSRFQTIDAAGNLVRSTHETKQPYYFPPAKFTLVVSNEAAATFAFKIVWAPFPSVRQSNTVVGMIPQLQNATNSLYNSFFGTTNKMSLLVFPENIHKSVHLRSVLVFEGYGTNPTYKSNLELVYKTGKQYIADSGEIVLINMEVTNTTDYFLLQEFDTVKNLGDYKALECNPNSNCSVSIHSGNGPSGLVVAPHGNMTLLNVQMDPNANISIYYGSISNFGFVMTYTGADINKALPKYLEWVWQFVVSNGKAVFNFNT